MTNDKQRERLAELLQEASTEAGKYFRETTKKVLAEKGRFNSATDIDRRNIYEVEADYLLENGVIVPPCKVGQTVWGKRGCFISYPTKWENPNSLIPCEVIVIKESKKGKYILLKPLLIETYGMRKANERFPFSAIGKTVFLTKEEAEKALGGCAGVKQKDIPFKERKRNYDYQFNQPDRQEELLLKKEAKQIRKLKEQTLQGGDE